jgi:hypothetical protein
VVDSSEAPRLGEYHISLFLGSRLSGEHATLHSRDLRLCSTLHNRPMISRFKPRNCWSALATVKNPLVAREPFEPRLWRKSLSMPPADRASTIVVARTNCVNTPQGESGGGGDRRFSTTHRSRMRTRPVPLLPHDRVALSRSLSARCSL